MSVKYLVSLNTRNLAFLLQKLDNAFQYKQQRTIMIQSTLAAGWGVQGREEGRPGVAQPRLREGELLRTACCSLVAHTLRSLSRRVCCRAC